MKKIILAILTIVSVLGCSIAFAATVNNNFAIYVNDKVVRFTDVKPFIDQNARTMIPLRAVSETMGAKVTWDQKTQIATVELNDKKIEFPAGKNYALINGKKAEFDTVTIVIESRVFIPLRFVSESLSYKVTYKYGIDTRSSNTGKYHIIDLKKVGYGSLLEGGYGTMMPQEDTDHPEKFFPGLAKARTQVQMIADSIHFDASNTGTTAFEPDVSIWYTKKGLITISFQTLPSGWDYFLKQALTYMMGADGTTIATQITKTYNTVKSGSTYSTDKLAGKSFTVGKFKTTYKLGKEIQITFVEK